MREHSRAGSKTERRCERRVAVGLNMLGSYIEGSKDGVYAGGDVVEDSRLVVEVVKVVAFESEDVREVETGDVEI